MSRNRQGGFNRSDVGDRRSYLEQLMNEFRMTNSNECKRQVLANLANFSYDPANFEYLRQLQIIPLFLDQLKASDQELVEFACSGLCNLALDPKNKGVIINRGGVQLLIECLASSVEETVLSSITTLTFLITPESKNDITCPLVIQYMARFAESNNRRLSNLAQIFLQDFCTSSQVHHALEQNNILEIPVLNTIT